MTTNHEPLRPFSKLSLVEIRDIAADPKTQGPKLILALDETVRQCRANGIDPSWSLVKLDEELYRFRLERFDLEQEERVKSTGRPMTLAAEVLAGILTVANPSPRVRFAAALKLGASGPWLRMEVVRDEKGGAINTVGPFKNQGLALSSRTGRPTSTGTRRPVQWVARMTEDETDSILDLLEPGESKSGFTRSAILREMDVRSAPEEVEAVKVVEALPQSADVFVWGAMHNAGKRGTPRERWIAVKQTFGVGSTMAYRLCQNHGLDPDEIVGREAEVEE